MLFSSTDWVRLPDGKLYILASISTRSQDIQYGEFKICQDHISLHEKIPSKKCSLNLLSFLQVIKLNRNQNWQLTEIRCTKLIDYQLIFMEPIAKYNLSKYDQNLFSWEDFKNTKIQTWIFNFVPYEIVWTFFLLFYKKNLIT